MGVNNNIGNGMRKDVVRVKIHRTGVNSVAVGDTVFVYDEYYNEVFEDTVSYIGYSEYHDENYFVTNKRRDILPQVEGFDGYLINAYPTKEEALARIRIPGAVSF